MNRRTAFQSLVAIMCGAWTSQQRKPNTSTTTGTFEMAYLNAPVSLQIHMGWKDITVIRNGESVTIDQDELFRALKGDAK